MKIPAEELLRDPEEAQALAAARGQTTELPPHLQARAAFLAFLLTLSERAEAEFGLPLAHVFRAMREEPGLVFSGDLALIEEEMAKTAGLPLQERIRRAKDYALDYFAEAAPSLRWRILHALDRLAEKGAG